MRTLMNAAPAPSGGRETVKETTSLLDSGYPAGGNCLRTVSGATPS